MKALVYTACIILAGCATGPQEPIDPARAAILMQMIGNQNAANAAAWQNMQSNPVFQRQQPVYQAPVSPAVNCMTTGGPYSLYTTCR